MYGRVFGWIVSKINELLIHKLDANVELSEIGQYYYGTNIMDMRPNLQTGVQFVICNLLCLVLTPRRYS